MLSSSKDFTIRNWDGHTGNEKFTVLHGAGVNDVALAPDDRQFLSASDDGTVKVWNLQDLAEPTTLVGHAGPVTAVAVLPDGKRAVSGAADGLLKLWSLRTAPNSETFSAVEHSEMVDRIQIRRILTSPDGRFVVFISFCEVPDLGKTMRNVKVLDLESGPPIRELTGVFTYPAYSDALVFLDDGRSLLTPSLRGPVELWDVKRGVVLSNFATGSDNISAMAATTHCEKVIIGTRDGVLEVWDLESKKQCHTITAHSGQVEALCFLPTSQHVVSVSEDGSLKVWDIHLGTLLASFVDDDALTLCSATPNGSVIVAAGARGAVHFLKLAGKV